MDWHEATQRQVGSPGIREVRRLLADARAEAARERQDRNVVVAALAAFVMVAMLMVGLPTTSAAQPLPPGTYVATTPGGDVQVTVGGDGAVDVEAPPSLAVELGFDADGRVLDVFTVSRGQTTWDVALDVTGDGTYEVDVLLTDDGDVRGPLPFPGPGGGLLDDRDQRGDRGSSDAADRLPTRSTTSGAGDAPGVTEQPGGAAGGTAPADDGPAQSGGTPGRSDDAPGRADRAEVAPGRSDDAPGQVADPPGRTEEPPGRADPPGPAGGPGQIQDPPGQAADRTGRAEDRARGTRDAD